MKILRAEAIRNEPERIYQHILKEIKENILNGFLIIYCGKEYQEEVLRKLTKNNVEGEPVTHSSRTKGAPNHNYLRLTW